MPGGITGLRWRRTWCALLRQDYDGHSVSQGAMGPHADRLQTSEANWKQPPRWAKAARSSGERPRVFCASLADWLDNKAPQEWRVDLAALIAATPELDWLLLTKGPGELQKDL